jgi:hypothetical protein
MQSTTRCFALCGMFAETARQRASLLTLEASQRHSRNQCLRPSIAHTMHLLSSLLTASAASRSTKASSSSLLSTLPELCKPAAATALSYCCCRCRRSDSVTRKNFCVLICLLRSVASVLSLHPVGHSRRMYHQGNVQVMVPLRISGSVLRRR